MSERSPEALHAALAIMSQPQLLQRARRSSLPRGMTLLLEVAAGDPDAIREAQAATGRSEDHLTKAAGFYTEQVLLHRDSDSYRILGASSSASAPELRGIWLSYSDGFIRTWFPATEMGCISTSPRLRTWSPVLGKPSRPGSAGQRTMPSQELSLTLRLRVPRALVSEAQGRVPRLAGRQTTAPGVLLFTSWRATPFGSVFSATWAARIEGRPKLR